MSGFYLTDINIDHDKLNRKVQFLKSRGTRLTVNTVPQSAICIVDTSHSCPNIVLDGIIYNKQNSNLSDTEFLCELYNTNGINMLNQLNGSYAFIIYDEFRHILFGARDRLGEKPFFYKLRPGKSIECSSSLKAICSGEPYTINNNAKSMYMRFGWIYDTECIFNDVHKLPAGHYFIYNIDTHDMKIIKYWDVNANIHDEFYTLGKAEALEYLDGLINDAIRIRYSDANITGMGISSGTDSFSIYNYLLAMGTDVPLFNIVPKYSSAQYNEYPLAANHIATVNKNKQINVSYLDDADCLAGLSAYSIMYDEPNSDYSCMITNRLFKQMVDTNNITVAFSGIGADDCLFGKPIYGKFFENIQGYRLSSSVIERFCNTSIYCQNDFTELLISDDPLSMQRYNIKTYLPNLLIKEDVASQWYGIDIRNPYCDYRIVEFGNSVNLNVLFCNHVFKYMLKRIVLDKFGVNFFSDKKRGFAPEIIEFLKIKDISEIILDTLTKDNMLTYFPEVDNNAVNWAYKNPSIDSAQLLLNLYLYISVILQYKHHVCV